MHRVIQANSGFGIRLHVIMTSCRRRKARVTPRGVEYMAILGSRAALYINNTYPSQLQDDETPAVRYLFTRDSLETLPHFDSGRLSDYCSSAQSEQTLAAHITLTCLTAPDSDFREPHPELSPDHEFVHSHSSFVGSDLPG